MDLTSRCNWRRRRRDALWWLLLLVPLASGTLRPNADVSKDRAEGVCQSVDIRNTVDAFKRLSGCRVVEGFVQIVLIDHATENSFANLSFPELREITHYLLLYRVNGLRSLGKLFPNLSVIRGEVLFLNYALVVFEMIHLQELGLYSLTDILRGGVRIEKNPLLCFVDTVDWDVIVKGDHTSSITSNRVQNECPMCPVEQLRCHNSSKLGSLCWNRQNCQKVCPDSCGNRSCMANGKCCHESCLGGCTGEKHTDCLACRDVLFQNMCLKNCPSDSYKYLNRRCISADECRNISRPRERNYGLRPKPYKPFNYSCMLECPAGFMETMDESNKYSCTRCKGRCRKECQGVNIDSIAAAQRMNGCTYIKGSLEIQIRGGKNVVKELEDNLNMIEEIEGYLKIVRSFPLISLNFLRNLRVIHGNELDSKKYSFVLLDNQNLQELWDWEHHTEGMKILRGKLFFHFNPKLCFNRIVKLKEKAQLPEFTDLEVATNSNGDKVACNVTKLKAQVTKYSALGAIIVWESFHHYDDRTLLGYVVYYIEAPYKNVTMYDGRDACGGDGWHMQDLPVTYNTTLLTYLKPYTQYAFYVKAYTIATERTGAQSDIQYFKTLPSHPTQPMGLDVKATSSNSLTIKWLPPEEQNGNVTHYVIIGKWINDDQSLLLDQRNYCNEPLIPETKRPVLVVKEENVDTKDKNGCLCIDDKGSKGTEVNEREVAAQIHFEDSLHNILYVKRPTQSRRKRDVTWHDTTLRMRRMVSPRLVEQSEFGDPDYQTTPHRYPETTEDNTDMSHDSQSLPNPNHHFRYVVYGRTQFEVKNLTHYTQFHISVEACREIEPNEPPDSRERNCSSKTIKTGRTLPLAGADNVESSKLKAEVLNDSIGRVKLGWEEPPSPNGIIVTYQIEYRSLENPNYPPMVECISRNQFSSNGSSYILQNLSTGNYSLRVRAMSFAGYGDYTEYKYFNVKPPASSRKEYLIWAFVGAIAVTILLCFTVVYLRRKYIPGIPNVKLIATVNPEYVSTVYEPDEWEVPRKKVELLNELGQGSFGMVYEGIVQDVVEDQPNMRCAIKTVNEHATDRERSEFLNEASVMKAFNTHHVVRLLGVVSQGQPVLVVMELMAHGDLKTYLRSHRPDVCENSNNQPPTLKRILQMAVEIADGMAYLANKKFVHRDLAARNCMVAEDLTVKIGDFGMTRDIYETDYYRKGTKGLLPVRWMAPESLKDGVFTSHSDVWSYGVVLWEMATLASQPYQGLSNDQVLRYVIDGGVMERPENCPDRLYQLMRLCWHHKPLARPPFVELVTLLLPDVSSDFAKVSFYHSEEGRELCAPTDDPSTPLRVTRDVEDFSLSGRSEDEEDVEAAFHNYQSMSLPRNGKVGNGSPTTANGWVTGSVGMKTTQC